jgi:hypothetical protein
MSAIEREQRRPRCGEDSRARGLHSRLRSGLCELSAALGRRERARLSGRRWGPTSRYEVAKFYTLTSTLGRLRT